MSNLYKTSYMNMGNDRRVIDMNELVKKRIDALGIKMQRPENSGFVDGINADKGGVEELVNGVTLDGDYPEGGFSESEVRKLTEAGAVSVSLGKTVLRVETASVAALAMIMYEMELSGE